MPKIVLIVITLLVVLGIIGLVFSSFKILGLSIGPLKNTYVIAVYGDSMVDTMGENLEYLQTSLKKRYPSTTFYYYNYGIGGQNVTQGLERFDKAFDYKTRHYPPLSTLKPDIIILGSYAYNPYSPHNRDLHWSTLSALIDRAKQTGADVYQLVEIAPLESDFGKGVGGVNWPESIAATHSYHITEQLENAIFLANDHQKIPLINAYYSTKSNGRFGSKRYVSVHDGIHPSVLGHQLTANLIAAKIKLR